MRKTIYMLLVVVSLIAYSFLGDGCEETQDQSAQQKQVERTAGKLKAYLPKNFVELRNYNDAQKLYDSPSSILWCTAFPSNPSAPLITVPISGKLTSSSTTFFSPEHWSGAGSESGAVVLPSRSVDGLFHPNPPQYRYGFTPGGQYADFFNIETFCTTAMSKFQRQSTKIDVSPDAEALKATTEAERLLAQGDHKGAQNALQGLDK